jgi:hypothetical protein
MAKSTHHIQVYLLDEPRITGWIRTQRPGRHMPGARLPSLDATGNGRVCTLTYNNLSDIQDASITRYFH